MLCRTTERRCSGRQKTLYTICLIPGKERIETLTLPSCPFFGVSFLCVDLTWSSNLGTEPLNFIYTFICRRWLLRIKTAQTCFPCWESARHFYLSKYNWSNPVPHLHGSWIVPVLYTRFLLEQLWGFLKGWADLYLINPNNWGQIIPLLNRLQSC